MNLLSIDYAFRPDLRPWLPLRGRTLRRNPHYAVFGALDSHQSLPYSSRHSRFRFVHNCSRRCFPLRRNAPLPMLTSHSFGRSLSPVHLRRKSARSVSYYALFQGWLLLGKPPGCLCTPTSFIFITERSFRGRFLSWWSGLFPSRRWSLSPIVSLADLDPCYFEIISSIQSLLVPLSRPAPKECFTPRCPVNCCAST